MTSLVTLVWSERLSDASFKNIIQAYAASELAEAWAAPEKILNRMEKLMPEKKKRLIESYLRQKSPNRRSRAFSSLHQSIIEAITEAADERAEENSGAHELLPPSGGQAA